MSTACLSHDRPGLLRATRETVAGRSNAQDVKPNVVVSSFEVVETPTPNGSVFRVEGQSLRLQHEKLFLLDTQRRNHTSMCQP